MQSVELRPPTVNAYIKSGSSLTQGWPTNCHTDGGRHTVKGRALRKFTASQQLSFKATKGSCWALQSALDVNVAKAVSHYILPDP